MSTKTIAATTALLLTMGTTVSAQADMNVANALVIGIDSAPGSLTYESMITEGSGIAGEQKIIAKRKVKPPKCSKKRCK